LNVDFIASLPYAAGRLRLSFILNVLRDKILVCVMIRRENVSTIMTGEKRAPFGAVGLDRN
jgi:hypothetical protein